ncbi:MAG: hypothetical protein V4526_00550 [Patescibacteria group bacterium]
MSDKNLNKNLDEALRKIRTAQDNLKAHEANLRTAQDELNKITTEQQPTIASIIKEGGTTGDPLLDEFIPAFGLDEDLFFKLKELSDNLLIKGKGKELLLKVCYSQNIFGSGSRPGDYHPCTGYILGTLSRERIKVKTRNGGIVIPFKSYVMWGMDNFANSKLSDRLSGGLELHSFSRPSNYELLQSLKPTEQASTMQLLSLETKGGTDKLDIFLWEQINAESEKPVVPPDELQAAREVLYKEEQVPLLSEA